MPTGVYKRKPHTEETKIKISNANSGKKHSDEFKRGLSERNKRMGIIPPNRRGAKMSEDAKKRISENSAKYWEGKTLPKYVKEKISKSRKGKRSGSECHLWRGGITEENHKIRQSFEYKLWRKSCFERDNFTCQKTGVSGGELVVHHINNFSDFPELRFSIDNGVTLSKKSHILFHKIYGKRNNTREQLEEYLNGK